MEQGTKRDAFDAVLHSHVISHVLNRNHRDVIIAVGCQVSNRNRNGDVVAVTKGLATVFRNRRVQLLGWARIISSRPQRHLEIGTRASQRCHHFHHDFQMGIIVKSHHRGIAHLFGPEHSATGRHESTGNSGSSVVIKSGGDVPTVGGVPVRVAGRRVQTGYFPIAIDDTGGDDIVSIGVAFGERVSTSGKWAVFHALRGHRGGSWRNGARRQSDTVGRAVPSRTPGGGPRDGVDGRVDGIRSKSISTSPIPSLGARGYFDPQEFGSAVVEIRTRCQLVLGANGRQRGSENVIDDRSGSHGIGKGKSDIVAKREVSHVDAEGVGKGKVARNGSRRPRGSVGSSDRSGGQAKKVLLIVEYVGRVIKQCVGVSSTCGGEDVRIDADSVAVVQFGQYAGHHGSVRDCVLRISVDIKESFSVGNKSGSFQTISGIGNGRAGEAPRSRTEMRTEPDHHCSTAASNGAIRIHNHVTCHRIVRVPDQTGPDAIHKINPPLDVGKRVSKISTVRKGIDRAAENGNGTASPHEVQIAAVGVLEGIIVKVVISHVHRVKRAAVGPLTDGDDGIIQHAFFKASSAFFAGPATSANVRVEVSDIVGFANDGAVVDQLVGTGGRVTCHRVSDSAPGDTQVEAVGLDPGLGFVHREADKAGNVGLPGILEEKVFVVQKGTWIFHIRKRCVQFHGSVCSRLPSHAEVKPCQECQSRAWWAYLGRQTGQLRNLSEPCCR